mgnify:CR=1 FL=1
MFKIGNVEIGSGAVLGPMAGFSDMPFRALCIEQGASLSYTEMISAKGLHYKNRNSLPLLAVSENEGPVAVQLFGSEPELMAEEAKKLESGPYDIFDINMGCPMPKIVNNGEGSALMRNPSLVGEIVSAMSETLTKPVTIKIRKGFNDEEINAVQIAKVAEANGAAAIAVHGRTREEYYSGKADWDIIRRVREAVSIPVIGSGDIYSAQDAAGMLEETGCDAVMVARGARGNPWIFREIKSYLETGEVPARPDKEEIKEMVMRHLDMMVEFAGEWSAVRQMRKHAGFYCTGFPNATTLRREINKAESREAFERTLTMW